MLSYHYQCCGSASLWWNPDPACQFNPDSNPACHFYTGTDQDPGPVCHFDADPYPDPTFHFDAVPDQDPNPSFHIKAQTLKRAQIGSLSHFPYILARHLQIDADPDPAYDVDADADLDPTFQIGPDPQHCLLLPLIRYSMQFSYRVGLGKHRAKSVFGLIMSVESNLAVSRFTSFPCVKLKTAPRCSLI
jgi:hypothetical protein